RLINHPLAYRPHARRRPTLLPAPDANSNISSAATRHTAARAALPRHLGRARARRVRLNRIGFGLITRSNCRARPTMVFANVLLIASFFDARIHGQGAERAGYFHARQDDP